MTRPRRRVARELLPPGLRPGVRHRRQGTVSLSPVVARTARRSAAGVRTCCFHRLHRSLPRSFLGVLTVVSLAGASQGLPAGFSTFAGLPVRTPPCRLQRSHPSGSRRSSEGRCWPRLTRAYGDRPGGSCLSRTQHAGEGAAVFSPDEVGAGHASVCVASPPSAWHRPVAMSRARAERAGTETQHRGLILDALELRRRASLVPSPACGGKTVPAISLSVTVSTTAWALLLPERRPNHPRDVLSAASPAEEVPQSLHSIAREEVHPAGRTRARGNARLPGRGRPGEDPRRLAGPGTT